MIKLRSGLLAVVLLILSLLQLPFSKAEADVRSASNVLREAYPLSIYFLEAIEIVDAGIGKAPALNWLATNWSDQFLPYCIEIRRFFWNAQSVEALAAVFEEKTGLAWSDYDSLNQYVWSKNIRNTADYAQFKQFFHTQIDPRFERYFESDRRFNIRLDEITWGGVVQDGIPPLRGPKMLKAAEASYLKDSNVVFGLEINGDARAYPKRILAWHEMFVDKVGGVSLAGVYCTLCGTVIAYDTEFEGTNHALGTSGFLYRSNKLMYDQATQSLWSTLEGVPVVGPLVDKGIQLRQYALVTTTWGEWKRRHPDTLVLSKKTGHQRNYDEGHAYHDYFATDERMFETPFTDERLKNKDEVLALRFAPEAERKLVISEGFLRKHPIYEGSYNGQPYVVLTDASGANRVYERPEDLTFTEWDQVEMVRDTEGHSWTLSEASLTTNDGRRLERLAAHRAFWFCWHGAFPDTELIQ